MTLDVTALVAEIERLANAATPGPWEFRPDRLSGSVFGPSTNEQIPSPDVVATPSFSDRSHAHDRAKMEFIAAAREAVPTLVARIRELESAIIGCDAALGEAEEVLRLASRLSGRQTQRVRERRRKKPSALFFQLYRLARARGCDRYTSLRWAMAAMHPLDGPSRLPEKEKRR